MRIAIEHENTPTRVIEWSGEGTVVLGRGANTDVPIDDHGIGRRHCTLRMTGNVVWVEDLGSHNGVHVRGDRVDRAPIAPGEAFTIGFTTIRLLPADAGALRWAFEPFEPYPRSERFDSGRVYGAPSTSGATEIVWEAWATAAAFDAVAAFYEEHHAGVSIEREPGVLRLRLPTPSVLDVSAPARGKPYDLGKLRPGLATVILVSVRYTRPR